MCKRFVAIWFRHLKTDWMIHHHPELRNNPFVLAASDHGRMRITEVSVAAKTEGLEAGMVVADARIIVPSLQVLDDTPGLAQKLLQQLGRWCIRYTPITAVDLEEGLILDISGCPHLWGTEETYLLDICSKLEKGGYHIQASLADTIGAAWALSRYGKHSDIIPPGKQAQTLLSLPPAALRLDPAIVERLHKLGLQRIGDFMGMQRSALRRRFGDDLLLRLDQALGRVDEPLQPLEPVLPFRECLPCLEAIRTRTGIEIALHRLLEMMCKRLQQEGKGIRTAVFKCYRTDNNIQQIAIATNHPSYNATHLFKLFDLKINTIEPALGIELFLLEAPRVDSIQPLQQGMWSAKSNLQSQELAELLERIECRFGENIIHRYLPDEHHLPERSIRSADDLKEIPAVEWRNDKCRPILLFPQPRSIEVTAPIPDYPPMNFRYDGKLHKVEKADGPERIEPEWWLDPGQHRDYYIVEDEEGRRYWVFRSGHYDGNQKPSWFLHGFFA